MSIAELYRQHRQLSRRIGNAISGENIIQLHGFAEIITDKRFELTKNKVSEVYGIYDRISTIEWTRTEDVENKSINLQLYSNHTLEKQIQEASRKFQSKLEEEIYIDYTIEYHKLLSLIFKEKLSDKGYKSFENHIKFRILDTHKNEDKTKYMHNFLSDVTNLPKIITYTIDWYKTEFSSKFIPSVISIIDQYLIQDLRDIIFIYC